MQHPFTSQINLVPNFERARSQKHEGREKSALIFKYFSGIDLANGPSVDGEVCSSLAQKSISEVLKSLLQMRSRFLSSIKWSLGCIKIWAGERFLSCLFPSTNLLCSHHNPPQKTASASFFLLPAIWGSLAEVEANRGDKMFFSSSRSLHCPDMLLNMLGFSVTLHLLNMHQLALYQLFVYSISPMFVTFHWHYKCILLNHYYIGLLNIIVVLLLLLNLDIFAFI